MTIKSVDRSATVMDRTDSVTHAGTQVFTHRQIGKHTQAHRQRDTCRQASTYRHIGTPANTRMHTSIHIHAHR